MSPDTLTANWLHVEGGEGGGVSFDRFTGKGCKVRGGGRSVLIRGYSLTKDKGRFLQHRLVARSFQEVPQASKIF